MRPVASTRHGKVGGVEITGGVSAFLGIPYAAPLSGPHADPAGPALFAAPAPPVGWDGLRDATRLGATVPKPVYVPPFDRLLTEPAISGDEPLNVNVWTPDPGGSGLPVLVWIHGGAFRNGSNAVPNYDGAAFARDGVVLVSINYRLGVPGFAALPDAPANRGILDQLAALAWVQDNIAAFGGDPGNVTIFGESAGGMSVTTLVSIAAGRGLFRRAIAQSGAGHSVARADDARLASAQIAGRLGVEPTAAALGGVPVDEVIAAQHSAAIDMARDPDPARWGRSVVASSMTLLPYVDGELITQRPVDAVAAGAGADIPLLIGATRDEWRFFIAPLGITESLTADGLRTLAAARGWSDTLVERYTAARPDASPGDVFAALTTDSFFRLPAIRLADAHRKSGGENFHYEFAWSIPGSEFGSCHTMEIPFVFDTVHRSQGHPLVGPEPPQELADRMHAAWISFARTGDPGWPAYDGDWRPVQRFDHPESALVDDPRGDERALWDGLV